LIAFVASSMLSPADDDGVDQLHRHPPVRADQHPIVQVGVKREADLELVVRCQHVFGGDRHAAREDGRPLELGRRRRAAA